ncbi:tryptophan-rich sensory protein [Pseudoflavonifractor phocaeensis]|nr:tryptophan-rich sensory protein [Pseudoflavonifractor phocaeensis]
MVWGILFALMGIGAARIYLTSPSRERTSSLRIFLLQLAFNFFWSILFFNFQAFGAALVWLVILWGLILWMITSFHKVDPLAAWLQVPYLLWVTFAAYLNYGVWILN